MSAAEHGPPAAGPYLQTVSGRWVNPFDPDPGQLDIGDSGDAEDAFAALMHHAPEAYLGDMPTRP